MDDMDCHGSQRFFDMSVSSFGMKWTSEELIVHVPYHFYNSGPSLMVHLVLKAIPEVLRFIHVLVFAAQIQ